MELAFRLKGTIPPVLTALGHRTNLISSELQPLFDFMMLRFPLRPPSDQHPEYFVFGRLEIVQSYCHPGRSFRCSEKDDHSGTKTPQFTNVNLPHNPNGLTAQPTADHVATFILLQRELADNVDCLFVFVEHPEVEPTNNRSERNVRREAEIRKGARTSKTVQGAKRRGTIVTVLASLQTRISNFTLSNVIAEIDRWLESGSSLFQQELQAIHDAHPPPASA